MAQPKLQLVFVLLAASYLRVESSTLEDRLQIVNSNIANKTNEINQWSKLLAGTRVQSQDPTNQPSQHSYDNDMNYRILDVLKRAKHDLTHLESEKAILLYAIKAQNESNKLANVEQEKKGKAGKTNDTSSANESFQGIARKFKADVDNLVQNVENRTNITTTEGKAQPDLKLPMEPTNGIKSVDDVSLKKRVKQIEEATNMFINYIDQLAKSTEKRLRKVQKDLLTTLTEDTRSLETTTEETQILSKDKGKKHIKLI